jgi:quinoprotein dehydrogenase-associated probable ABC transporter substrate-binding protein
VATVSALGALGALAAIAMAGVHYVTGPRTMAFTSAGSVASRPPLSASRALRVCADPNNLPFSNEREEGFENRIAELIAREMHADVEYTWWAQRRGYIRNTLGAGACDVLIGVPVDLERVATTKPYYRSSYAFVYRADRGLRIASFDDPALERLQVGVQLVGDDYINTPPAHALSSRGIVRNVHGYSVVGDYGQPNPPARIIDALVSGDIDVAVAWGPLAGYFARRAPVPLRVVPVSPQQDGAGRPMAFDIAMGVRREDRALRDTLDAIIARRRAEIDRILDDFGVPRTPAP